MQPRSHHLLPTGCDGQVAATVPVFAILDPQRRLGGAAAHYDASVDVAMGAVDASLTDAQLKRLGVFAMKVSQIVRQQAGMHEDSAACGHVFVFEHHTCFAQSALSGYASHWPVAGGGAILIFTNLCTPLRAMQSFGYSLEPGELHGSEQSLTRLQICPNASSQGRQS